MEVVLRSIFKNDIVSFLDFVQLSLPVKKTFDAYRRTLYDFDSFLFIEGLAEKKLEAELIQRWLDGFSVHPRTINGKISHLKRFAGYLFTLGIKVTLPERPRVTTDFAPYVFTEEEMAQIFEIADDLVMTNPKSKVAAEFPMLVRLLYGCGLRLGEAVTLTWDNVNLDTGVITVKFAKNNKQRLVPMTDELTRILKLYRNAPCFEMQKNDFLFKTGDGKQRNISAYWQTFDKILCELGIKNVQTVKYGVRGPCIHSLRHTFTLRSFLKAESEGREFMEANFFRTRGTHTYRCLPESTARIVYRCSCRY